mmetsp:Transcript_118195/g.204273  ORF Transcript_118195/g.204273 Transcript_118195/m.204273 type:complete len:519 (-) Transcript_118195:138-1694(-)
MAAPLVVRRSSRAVTAMPRVLNSGLAERNGNESTGIRSVTFAPEERVLAADADLHDLAPAQQRSDWSHLGPIMGFDDDMDGTGSAAMTPSHHGAGTLSTPLRGLRAANARGVTMVSPTLTMVSPTRESPQFAGSQSMPMTNFLRRTPTSTLHPESPQLVGVQSIPMANFLKRGASFTVLRSPVVLEAADVATSSTAPGEQFRGGTMTVPLHEFRMPRAQSSPEDVVIRTSAASGKNQLTRRCKTVNFGARLSPELKVVVVAPGGGTGMNASVYSKLKHKDDISLQIVGQSRAPYDRYTEAWGAPSGGPAPNLETFAMDLSSQGALDHCDCLVVGSRGGQVCLPTFWRMQGEEVPPAVVLNGGCAMQLPIQVPWPDSAVTFLLLGGQDYFRQQFTVDQYLRDAQSRVPHENSTTAIMLVQEMAHMPQAQLLDATLHSTMKAVTSWKEDRDTIPIAEFQEILAAVTAIGFHAQLIYKTGPGDAWDVTEIPDVAAGHQGARRPAQTFNVTTMQRAAPIHRD